MRPSNRTIEETGTLQTAGKAGRLIIKEPLPHPLTWGVGFNWFDHLGSGGCFARSLSYPLYEEVIPDPLDKQAWAAVEEVFENLRPGLIRFGLPPDPHVDAQGRLITDTVHLRRLRWLGDWAMRNGCTIIVDPFTTPRYYEFPPPPGVGETIPDFCNMAAADNHAYARRFAAPLMKLLLDDWGLKSIRWFCPINEPLSYGVYQTPADGPEPYAHYVGLYRELRQEFDAIGLGRDRLGLLAGAELHSTGLGMKSLNMQLLGRGLDITPWIDSIGCHYYNLRFDHMSAQEGASTTAMRDVIEVQTAQFVEYGHLRGLGSIASEIGTFYYGWRTNDPAGAASCDACLTVAEGVIRGMNAGLEGFALWCLFNPNNIDGWWRVAGVENGRMVRTMHPWHIYGLLSRHARPGSRVRPLDRVRPDDVLFPGISHIHGTCLTAPDGHHTILLVNDHHVLAPPITLSLPMAPDEATWRRIVTDRVRLMSNEPVPEANAEGDVMIRLSPMSLTVLTTRTN